MNLVGQSWGIPYDSLDCLTRAITVQVIVPVVAGASVVRAENLRTFSQLTKYCDTRTPKRQDNGEHEKIARQGLFSAADMAPLAGMVMCKSGSGPDALSRKSLSLVEEGELMCSTSQ